MPSPPPHSHPRNSECHRTPLSLLSVVQNTFLSGVRNSFAEYNFLIFNLDLSFMKIVSEPFSPPTHTVPSELLSNEFHLTGSYRICSTGALKIVQTYSHLMNYEWI